MTVKILAACGAGVNSSHQTKDAIEKEFKKRGIHRPCLNGGFDPLRTATASRAAQ